MWNCPQVNATRPHWQLLNIGSGNGLVPSGNKPLPEPMLIQIYVTIWHHITRAQWVNPCCAEFILGNKDIFPFNIISQHYNHTSEVIEFYIMNFLLTLKSWQVPQQHCYQGPCQISKRYMYNDLNYKGGSYKTSQDLNSKASGLSSIWGHHPHKINAIQPNIILT